MNGVHPSGFPTPSHSPHDRWSCEKTSDPFDHIPKLRFLSGLLLHVQGQVDVLRDHLHDQ